MLRAGRSDLSAASARKSGNRNELTQAETDLGFCGLYIIGPRSGYPICFGVAKQSADAWYAIKRGYWELHQIHSFCWTPGKPAAERVKKALAERLGDLRRFENPEWYDISAAEALGHMQDIAGKERVELFDDVEKMRRVERHVGKVAKKIAAFEQPKLMAPQLKVIK